MVDGTTAASGSSGAAGAGTGGRSGRGRGGRGGNGRGRGRGGRGKGGRGRGSSDPNNEAKDDGGSTAKHAVSGAKKQPKKNPKSKGNNNNNKNNSKKKPEASKEPRLSAEETKKRGDEKKKAEALEVERQRLEAEQAALKEANAAREKAEEDLNEQVKEATDYLDGMIKSVTLHRDNRLDLSPDALGSFRKSFEANKKALKSDLKKCTAFVKKVKGGSAWSMKPDDIVRDIKSLNLSRYVEEVVAAILDAKLKVTDLPVVLALSKAMHERYPDFLATLTSGLWSVVTGKSKDESGKNRRIYVRILTEFLLNGLNSETKPLLKLITEASGGKDGSYAVSDATIIVAFAKTAGFEILGVPSTSFKRYSEIIDREVDKVNESEERNGNLVLASTKLITQGKEARAQVNELLSERAISEDVSSEFLKHCQGAHKTLTKSLIATHGKLQKMEKRCEQDRLLSGTLPEAREKGLADARRLRESLLKTVEALSDVLNLTMAKLKEEQNEEDESGGTGLEIWTKGGGEDGADFGPFDDEETKVFYCDVPDFLTTIPPGLLGVSPDEIEKRKAENLAKFGSGFDSVTEEPDGDTTDVAGSTEEQLEAAEMGESDLSEESQEEVSDENKETPHYKLMVLLEQEMPECNRREQVDELAEKFCTNHGSSKNSRKRLIQTLFLVPRTRLDLLPFYSRLTASLSRVWSEIATTLVNDLEQQFHGQAKFKKNQNMESRMKTARYIGELTKFRLAPPMVSFRCIRRCLDDFTSGNVDVACCLLESCGRYLYRLKHTNPKLQTLMEAMTRLSKARHLDERSQALIKTAFYTVKPPPSGPKKKAKVYPPLEGYLRYLLMVKLQPIESSISFVSKQLIRCPWEDEGQQCGSLICKIMVKACRHGRYKSIEGVALVVSKIRRHKPEVGIRLLDFVLEELQLAMEYPSFKDQQRTLTVTRLLGELYCSSLASGQLIIQQLHKFINFGHSIPRALKEASGKLVERAVVESAPNSSGTVSQIIKEDTEMSNEDMEDAPVPKEVEPIAVSKYSVYDPRVPTVLDPPTSVFRVKLVCTLLETVSKTIVTRNNLSKLESFLNAFQRYLFTKKILPTEVEFALLDTFDLIDSQWRKIQKDGKNKKKNENSSGYGFPRYRTWLEAHNITVAAEEAEAIVEEKTRSRLENMAGDLKSKDGDDTIGSDIMNDDSDILEDEDDDASMEDALSVSERDSLEEDQDSYQQMSVNEETDDFDDDDEEDANDDDLDNGGDSDEDDMDEEEEDEFDEEAYMQQLEDEAFERELRRLTMDALEKGKNGGRGGKVADTMPTGSQVIRKKQGESEIDSVSPFALSGQTGISFQLLKKGNKGKMEAKQFYVPSDTNLAAVATKQDDEAAKERDMIKARVLQYEAESAEAEASGGNVYLEQGKLQVIRNRLSMDEIDKNFGTKGGNLDVIDKPKSKPSGSGPGRGPGRGLGRGAPLSSAGRLYGRGRGRGGGRNAGGRSLI